MSGRTGERAVMCARAARRIGHPRRGVWQRAGASLGALACSLPAAGERLLQLAAHDSAEMRRRAVFGLAAWAGHADEPIEALAALAQDPDPALRQMAVAALGRPAARSDAALDRLRQYLSGDCAAARAGAAQAFGYLLRRRTREALEALSQLARDDDPRVRAAAIAALALTPPQAADRALAVVSDFIEQHPRSTEPGNECEAVSRTLRTLAKHRPQKALGLVRRMAASSIEIYRWFAAHTLGARALAGQRGMRTLAQALARDNVASGRWHLAEALHAVARWAPARWQMALLRGLLRDIHRMVRTNAAEAMGTLAAAFPDEGVPLLSDLARDDDPYIRMGAAHAVADASGVDPHWALRTLRQLASDRDTGVRRAAAVALGALAQNHPDRAAPILCRVMEDAEPQVRAAALGACRALLPAHAQRIVPALAAFAADSHPQVRRAALEALYSGARAMPEPCAQAALALLGDESLRELATAMLAEASAARPKRTVDWLQEGGGAAGDERFFDVFAACHEDEEAAALAAGLKQVATAPDLPAAVERMAERIEASERLGGTAVWAALWRTAAGFLRVRALAELEAVMPAIARLEGVVTQDMPPLAESIARLAAAARLALRARSGREVEERLRNLAASKQIVEQVMGEPAPWSDPARVRVWRAMLLLSVGILGTAAEAAEARALVEARLVSKQAMKRRQVPLLVELHNAGASAARDLRIEVEPGEGHRPVGESAALAMLYPGERRQVEVPVEVGAGVSRLHVVARVIYADEGDEGRETRAEGDVVLLDPARPFRPIENPYLPGKPLEPGSPMFFGRKHTLRFLKSALSGPSQSNVVALWGQRRIGKTSILKQIGPRLGEAFFPVFIDVQGLLVDTVPLFLYQLAWHTARSLREEGVRYDVPPADDFARSPDLLGEQLAQAVEAAGGRRLVLMLDEFDDLDYKVTSGLLPPGVFDQLRHIMQHVPDCAFVLMGTHRIEELAGDYWSFLFNMALHRQVGLLFHDTVRALVEHPMAWAGVVCEDLATARICSLTGGHPYLTQLTCHMLIEQCNDEKRLIIAAEHVDDMAEELLHWAAPHMEYWWEGASPEERAVLAVSAEDSETAEAITADSVALRLAAAGVSLETETLQSAIQSLHEKTLLGSRGSEGEVYRLFTGLSGRWIRARWPVERVAHALRAGRWADGA